MPLWKSSGKKKIYSRRYNDVKDQIWGVYKSLTLDTLEEHMNVKKANILIVFLYLNTQSPFLLL